MTYSEKYLSYRGRESLSGGGTTVVGRVGPAGDGGGIIAEKKKNEPHYLLLYTVNRYSNKKGRVCVHVYTFSSCGGLSSHPAHQTLL